ncbi:MinD/ParA family protein, partial [Mycolicibacterium elephantis]
MTDRDDALRREPGWPDAEEADVEPAAAEPEPTPAPAPPRPPVDYPPPRYGPPPGSGPLPGGPRPEAGPWHGPPTRARRPPRPSAPPPPAGPRWPGYPGDAPAVQGPPSGSYAERIRAEELVPARREPPTRGWRLALYKATFGLVNLGPGPEEVRQA